MEIALAAAVVVWVVARQFAGRFVPARRSLLLPLVLVVVGVGQAGHVLVALPFLDTSAGPALEATLAASFGVSLAVQFAVFNARVARDGRPIRPARRRTDTRATLAR
jgi:hypothetical protein